MKVILTEDMDRLGKMGETVVVKDGYARNYLIPTKKAVPATAGNIKLQENIKKKRLAGEGKLLDEARIYADKISKLSITITVEAGEDEKLYGSVTSEMISKALAAEGVDIDKKDIVLEEPIKRLGVYQVEARLHPEVKTLVRVWVVKR